MKAVCWSAAVNGLLAPFLLLGTVLVARDRKPRQKQPGSRLSLNVVSATTLLMFCAGIGMFVF